MIKFFFVMVAALTVSSALVPQNAQAIPSASCLLNVGVGGWKAGNACASDSSKLEDTRVVNIVGGVMRWLLVLIGIFGVIAFVISGLMYMTAAGDDEQLGRAKKALKFAIIGVVVGLSGVIILSAIDTWLGGASEF